MPELLRVKHLWRIFDKSVTTKTQVVQTSQHPNATCSISAGSETNQCTFQRYLYGFHRRYRTTNDNQAKSDDLLFSRIVTITIWIFVIIIDFLEYSNVIKTSNFALKLIVSISYPLKDITSIVYASGTAAYGISLEIYVILPFVIVNCIFVSVNCGINHSETVTSITYMIKTFVLCVAIELGYQNHKRFKFQQSYRLHYQAATRAMLRQSLYFSATILFFVAPGLRAVYNGLRLKCPYRNLTANESYCNIIEFDRPMFEDDDPCASDFIAMVTGREHLRIIRDVVFLNIAFYSIYNKAFFDISRTSSRVHKLLLILFTAMSCSVLVANIDPMQYNDIRLYFNLIEIIISAIVVILLALNLRKKYDHKTYAIMEAHPTIFG